MQTEILVPALVLILWSLVMLVWMAAVRLPALGRAKIPLDKRKGGRGQDLEGVLAPEINWKAHNYAHLMEQPTLFYACVIILAMVGYSPAVLVAAWLYVGLRIVHSLWQSLVNTVPVRLALFLLGSLLLAFMAVNALLASI